MYTLKRIKIVFDNDLSKVYSFMREPYHANFYSWEWLEPLPEVSYWLGNPKLRPVLKWVNEKIILATDINSQKTEDVLVRIATGMINNLDIPDYYKRIIHENLLNNRRAARAEWNVYALKNSKGLPF